MTDIKTAPLPGWVGGFAQSNPAFAYPDPDLSSLPLLDNMANIEKLERSQHVKWPQFSWETVPGDPASRCYQMFAPQISRIGYTREGRVYSIICPQQGIVSPLFGALNVEVTVTSQRGWVDEDARGPAVTEDSHSMAADMTVEGKIWFSPSGLDSLAYALLAKFFESRNLPFPDKKANAIRVKTSKRGDPEQPVFHLSGGLTTWFKIPEFARHDDEAWDVGNIDVQINEHFKSGCAMVDDFNQLVLDIFNLGSGNLLAPGNMLSWNVWFTAPEAVDGCEWYTHAETWRRSIDADHGSPDGEGTSPQYYDGRPFHAGKDVEAKERALLEAYFEKHIGDFEDSLESDWEHFKDEIEDAFESAEDAVKKGWKDLKRFISGLSK
ncbi:hypothetical protein QWY75_00410 [Pontixanthobacter aestiaquae]|uniref:hypothetical protein n=1 Tax=Pontixanthobacter aestiaquae TaxID=1509367 RepID=UPI001929651B|nr:hypothetical protein [Pontixanthobacter aestiaquae]MDN3644660.1 hypothetical protein [Pontixanthobacter aestiaquae]